MLSPFDRGSLENEDTQQTDVAAMMTSEAAVCLFKNGHIVRCSATYAAHKLTLAFKITIKGLKVP